MGDLRPNISRYEIECKCGCGLDNIDPVILDVVQAVCTLTKSRVSFSSGCRCYIHNRSEGGSSKSKHMPDPVDGLCKAADFKIHRVNPIVIFNMLDPIWKGGLGKYNGFTHIDNRGRRARWDMT